ncbi:MAG: S24 family peptidase [Bacteroidales bacterium]|nr:S24 family peptidase [Bacteroidales bacterium]
MLKHYPDINAEWLLTGKGVMLKMSENPQDKSISDSSIPEDKLPFISLNAVGEMFSSEWRVAESPFTTYVVPAFKGADFLLSVEGTAMSPKYSPGDIVACKKLPTDTFLQWNKVYVFDTTQGALIKRVQKGITDDTLLLVSENPDYESFEIKRSQIYNMAIVSGVIRIE